MDMTSPSVAGLMIHEADGIQPSAGGAAQVTIGGPPLVAVPPGGFAGGKVPRTRPKVAYREALHRRLLSAADVLAAATGLILGLTVVGGTQVGPALAGVPLVVLLFKVAGLYDRDQMRLMRSTLDEAPILAQLTGLYALFVAILAPALTGGAVTAGQIATLWVAGFTATAGGRVIARWIAGRVSAVERCLLIGDAGRAEQVREKIRTSQARAAVVATLPLSGGQVGRWDNPATIRGIVEDLELHRIIIVPTMTDDVGIGKLIRLAKAAGVQVSVLPRMLDVVGSAVEFDDLDGMTMLGVRPFGLSRSSRLLKRGFDITVATIGLLAVAPALIAVAAAIRLDTK